MMEAVHIERLRALYAMIAGIPDELICLEEWRDTRNHSGDLSDAALKKGCGTIACAVGWACAYPEFNRQGLSWRQSPKYTQAGNQVSFGWGAVEAFFGLNRHMAEFLFYDEHVPFEQDRYEANRICGFPKVSQPEAKKVLLKRLRKYLLHIGAITTERDRELALLESTGKLTP